MKCPFRKNIDYTASSTTSGYGYPTEWFTYEEFDDCIGEECAAFALEDRHDPDAASTKPTPICLLCRSKQDNKVLYKMP